MSTGSASDEELIREGAEEGRVGAAGRRSSLDEDLATRLARGVVDGFTEASQAFSHELEGANRFPELLGRSVAAMIRANARLLDEIATMVRQAAEGWGERPRRPPADDLDYERLADLVAARLGSTASGSDVVEPHAAARSKRTT
jgi:hypothetical protein